MSAKKGFETKVPEDDNHDSGLVSGFCEESSGYLDSGPQRRDADDSDNKKVSSDFTEQMDSGVCLSADLSSLKLSDTDTQTAQQPKIKVEQVISQTLTSDIFVQQDQDGDTQLHIAAVHGCQKSVGTLIRICRDKASLNIPNEYGHTPLHLAVMCGNAVVAKMLVLAGASVAQRDIAGETPIHIATAKRHLECLHALLAPVPHYSRKLSSALNQKNYDGQTCVHLATAAGDVKALQILVHYGADINAREGLAGWTPLHMATAKGDARLVEYLLTQCAGASRTPRDYAGRAPRRLARSPQVARLFAAANVDTDSESDDDDDNYDSDSESLYDKYKENANPINVA